MRKRHLKVIITEIIILLLILVVEISVFMCTKSVEFSSQPVSVMDGNYTMIVNGYDVSSATYSPNSYDPGLIFNNIDKNIHTIRINFLNRIYSRPHYEIYFSSDSNFSNENMLSGTIPFGTKDLLLTVPAGEFDNLRIDIDGKFSLDNIFVSDGIATTSTQITRSLSITRILILSILITFSIVIFMHWFHAQKNERRLSGYELFFCIACFCFYFLWAISHGYNYAPDEAMRYDVTRFMFDNNRLPIDSELLSNWGFSYAHLPTVLCNQLGYILMKITSAFTLDSRLLLLAARMVSVICCTCAVYFIIKITKILFKSPARWIMIVAFAFMPQFAFLSSYVNNDSVAILGITMIAYAWLLGIKYNWDYKNCLLLCVGMAICALSYYNSYAWILLSIFMFVISYLYQNKKDYKGLTRHIVFIVSITFLLAGYNFIRHLVLYGDLLGFETSHYYGELFAVESLLPDNRPSLSEQGVSLLSMLFDRSWFKISWQSFVGVFGYMNVYCPNLVYRLAEIFVAIGIIGILIKLADIIIKKKKTDKMMLLFYISTLVCAVITVALSIYNSFFTDFQPQGRYCYPAFLTLVLFVAMGYDKIVQIFKKAEHKYAVVSFICTAFIGVSFYTFYSIYLPS